MIASDAHIAKFRAFKDGVMTSRNTFQKYYAQEELKEYIEATLGTKALPVASGVFFVFKDEEAEAQFTFRRYRRAPRRERTRIHRKSKAERAARPNRASSRAVRRILGERTRSRTMANSRGVQ